MTQGSYKQFCPVAMAAEVLCTRWTILVLRELIFGSKRFNDLRRGLPRMSPALLSQRLKELEAGGIVQKKPVPKDPGSFEYQLTIAGKELEPLIVSFGVWGQRWIETKVSLQNVDAQLLMWDMRRRLNPKPLPEARSTIHFQYPDAPASQRTWWLVVEPDTGVDLCSIDPGYDVDLYVSSDLRTMTAIWMGYETVRSALSRQRLHLTGDRKLASSMQTWLGLSSLAGEKSMVS
jgi:DNA-binding HxlR family transcriptional regulator